MQEPLTSAFPDTVYFTSSQTWRLPRALPDAFGDVCKGSTGCTQPAQCRTSPDPSMHEAGNVLMFFPFALAQVTSQTFLACPHTAIIKLFPNPKVIGRHGYWIFLHVAYFSSFFLKLNKHAHFPTFPSPSSLASFPLHKQCQETRSVKNWAAFLSNCVTVWNGTCESLKTSSMH